MTVRICLTLSIFLLPLALMIAGASSDAAQTESSADISSVSSPDYTSCLQRCPAEHTGEAMGSQSIEFAPQDLACPLAESAACASGGLSLVTVAAVVSQPECISPLNAGDKYGSRRNLSANGGGESWGRDATQISLKPACGRIGPA